jgi:hypothetical protein
MTDRPLAVPVARIQRTILAIRGQHVMLDRDLAALYGVEPKALNQAVKRNLDRFPDDFMFQLTWEEYEILRSQNVTIERGGGDGRGRHRKYPPYAFTEQGVAMLSGVLRSRRAVQVNVEIMRSFVRLRKMLASNEDLARQLADLERKYDGQFRVVFEAIRQLMTPAPPAKKRAIGFKADKKD